MICSQCGSDVAAQSAACLNCGAPSAGGADRLSRDDKVAGGATVLLLISLFLPWYTVSAPTEAIIGVTVRDGGSFSMDAFGGHGWAWIIFILGLAVLAYLVIQAGLETTPVRLPVSPAPALLGLTGLNLLLVFLAFLVTPGTGDSVIKVSIGWGIGAFLGLICAIVAFAPLWLPVARARTGR